MRDGWCPALVDQIVSHFPRVRTMEENIELAKLELERERVTEELKLKLAELDLKRAELEFKLGDESQKYRTSSPLLIAVITGIIGLISIGIANYLQSRANSVLEREKFESTAKLEREKFESSLILKAIETGNPEAATRNLLFLVKTGLIQDRTGGITALQNKPGSAPVLPLTGKAYQGQGQQDCGIWQSEYSGKQYTFICRDESAFDIFLNDPSLGLVKVGSGIISEGNVDATILVKHTGRIATVRLKLSDDRQELKGTFQGVDARESGPVIFRKVE